LKKQPEERENEVTLMMMMIILEDASNVKRIGGKSFEVRPRHSEICFMEHFKKTTIVGKTWRLLQWLIN
jgi:hypothetical protein